MGALPNDLKELFQSNRSYKGASMEAGKNPVKLPNRYKGIIKDDALDFLRGLLEMSPQTRLTAVEAL